MDNTIVLSLLLCIFVSAKAMDDKCLSEPYAGNVPWGSESVENSITSYSYDANSNECIAFIYSGSGGNSNRFKTMKECENACKEKNPCLQKPFSGRVGDGIGCFMESEAWSYVADKNECVYYDYTCGGNKNVFTTPEDCKRTCQKTRCQQTRYQLEKRKIAKSII